MNQYFRMFHFFRNGIFGVGFFLLALQGMSQDFTPMRYRVLEMESFARCFSFSPGGNYSALTTGDNGIHLFDAGYKEIWSSKGKADYFAGSCLFTNDEQFMIFTKYLSQTDIALYSIPDQRVLQFTKSQKYYIADVALSPDNKLVVTAGDARELKVYLLENKKLKLIRNLSVDSPNFQYINTVRFSPDGKFLAAAGIGTNLFIFSVNDTVIRPVLQEHFRYWTNSLDFSPDSKFLVQASSDSLYIWEKIGKTFKQVKAVDCSGGETSCLRFDPDGNFLLCGKENSLIKIYGWENGNPVSIDELDAHSDAILNIAFSPDAMFMATASTDKTLIIWSLGDVQAWEQQHDMVQKGIKINADTNKPVNPIKPNNFLLLIGINEYANWPQLNNAVGDAQAVGNLLKTNYGFDSLHTITIFNKEASLKNIVEKLSQLQKECGQNDNLLIYYSGHGYYNKEIDEGYWIPFDARRDEETDYLPNSTLVKYLKAMNCQHVFLVVDACFSGSLLTDAKKGYVERVGQFRSRWCLSSGRLELVSDGKIGSNSPFAHYFLKFLSENTRDEVTVSELIQYVKVAVSNNTEQTPIGSPLKNVGDEGGEFIFRRLP